MRQVVIGIVAAAALITSGIASARPQENRPADRPNEFGGSRPGAILGATNPYRGVEAQAIARGQQRLMQKSNFHAGMPGDTDTLDRSAKDMMRMSRGGHAGGSAGSVRDSLNVYKTTEILGIARGQERAQKRTNFHASRPADSTGANDKASRELSNQFKMGGGHGMSGAVRNSLNIYRTAEIMGIARGQERAQKRTNFHASRPADSSGANDKASREMHERYAMSGGSGRSAGVASGLNPYARVEQSAIARGMERARSKAGADAPMPKGLAADTLRPGDAAVIARTARIGSGFDFRNERTISARAQLP